ncbi:isocitrate dehydrogenase [Thermotomaculum hydrothermale]|uniref:Isocitrate dehydrogenase [NADP] n=1 Tax=Thermotomaculum hydrothermale TaxID=981385 RepID=A0A7R6SYY6_9BACT|nr:NADP-dependent isocitrate dehydrogenase [Thermotomaculum hydrothermale]BBB33284.1 isocitrate dehydrogenase [Thermotomaculum hydrothermale]
MNKIIWTKTDEAPYLATFALLPVVRGFLKKGGIEVDLKDISLAGRILATFPDYLEEGQRVPDDLKELGELVEKKGTKIIKLPNISASVVQLKAAIEELQKKGYKVPDYPEEPQTEEEKKIHERYQVCLGSAVNPVLRQGNSDRRAPKALKEYVKKNPKAAGLPLRDWEKDSKAHVAHMEKGDFFEHEQSFTAERDMTVRIEFVDKNGNVKVLKDNLKVDEGEILSSTYISVKELKKYFEKEIKDAKDKDLLLSLHLKATMMKVSDPPIFGHAVTTFFKDVFEKYEKEFKEIGVNPNNGLVDLYKKIEKLPAEKQEEIKKAIEESYKNNPDLAMVDSDKGITNLHAPNLVIVDASMPVVIREGGKMWDKNGELKQTKALIPDRCYATMYKEIVEDCKKNGKFDRTTIGTVQNIGLMAKKAEEYGSHDKTFVLEDDGIVRIVDENGKVYTEHKVEKHDIWRAYSAKDIAIKDWVGLAVHRAKVTGFTTIFWLDNERAHDREVIKKVEKYLKDYDTEGLDIKILKPEEAMKETLKRFRAGKDTISVTGNVLRDYLTDLFPIIEIGTSAKVLSIVPLLAGGGLFETGAGGSAPKHIQQFIEQGHLRWDSTAEFNAVGATLEFMEQKEGHKKAGVMGRAVEKAVSTLLENEQWPGRKVGQLDNRGSQAYFTLYWAEALAEQNEDNELKEAFKPIAEKLRENIDTIIKEISESEGKPADIDGYYFPDEEKVTKAMLPSKTFVSILEEYLGEKVFN